MTIRSCVLLTLLAMPALAQPKPSPAPMPMPRRPFAAVSDEDSLKIVALDGLMNADPDRGVPLAEGILKGSGSAPLKDGAMAALTRNKSARAQQVLSDYAKSGSDAELQARAIRYLGRSGSKESQQQLAGLYPAATDARVKQEIVRSLTSGGDAKSVIELARKESDPAMKGWIVERLSGMQKNKDAMDFMAELLK